MPGSFELAFHYLKSHLMVLPFSIQHCNYLFDKKLHPAPADVFNFTNHYISELDI